MMPLESGLGALGDPFIGNAARRSPSLADAIKRAHGGCAQCVSEAGKGSTFTMVLPAAVIHP